jgi:hypothetical protein
MIRLGARRSFKSAVLLLAVAPLYFLAFHGLLTAVRGEASAQGLVSTLSNNRLEIVAAYLAIIAIGVSVLHALYHFSGPSRLPRYLAWAAAASAFALGMFLLPSPAALILGGGSAALASQAEAHTYPLPPPPGAVRHVA